VRFTLVVAGSLHITADVALVNNEDVDAEESLLETRELARIPRF
jgi:hypothetical protein